VKAKIRKIWCKKLEY